MRIATCGAVRPKLGLARSSQVTDQWCCRSGLNTRPPPYQGGALPLSYGSKKRAIICERRERRGNCHKGPRSRKAKPSLACAATGHIIEFMDRTHKGNETRKNGSRNERLAGALRENLRRRKTQERARGESQPAGTTE